MKASVRVRHEAMNSQLEQFNVLATHFQRMRPNREGMTKKHEMRVLTVAVIPQLKFMCGMRTFGGVDCDVACW